MADAQFLSARPAVATALTNKVLRNTYMLLSMTLLWTALATGAAIAMNLSYMASLVCFLAGFGTLFAINRFRNSAAGLWLVFLFTGLMGLSLGPLMNAHLGTAAGSQVVMTAAGLTGLIFFSLSGYVLMTKRDFSFMAGFLMTGLWVMIGCVLLLWGGALFGFYYSPFHLAVSSLIVLLMSGFILFDTSRIVRGEETNYITATVGLYLNIYNIFISLLNLLGVMDD